MPAKWVIKYPKALEENQGVYRPKILALQRIRSESKANLSYIARTYLDK